MGELVKPRKYVIVIEEVRQNDGPMLTEPVLKAVVGGVIAIPYAGGHVADIQPMMKALEIYIGSGQR
jgi:hypothetical protein